MLKKIRRIVTENDENGKSRVMLDGHAEQIITVLTEMWLTKSGPHDHTRPVDLAKESTTLEPPKGGTVFRFFQIAPEAQNAHLSWEERQRAGREWFEAMGAAHLQPDTSRHETMHLSPTTDYIVLLSGEVTLVLDTEERKLKPFDVVIQRRTNHAWVNHGNEDALMLAVLVDGGGSAVEEQVL
ncbi:cupin domain-containing protein [Agrobacterium fabacearum]|uniref:cupin domain-containing protein n=1 Tax=Agrobacterium tumefaciens TaxID=358 RepID=UPI0028535894|nr:cupin domain-containing protein [Agrobacterium tumefaciens]MDR5012555.1 cupin domain-containing protein [Agrobacterium tumefaciens]